MTITLEPLEYWRLRALAGDVQRAQLEARATVQIAQAKQHAALVELGARYQFDPHVTGQLLLDDEGYTLTMPSGPTPVVSVAVADGRP